MSENLKMLGAYSNAMFDGDTEAVYEFWSPEFMSHVTERVSPERVGEDVRGEEQIWWQAVQASIPDMDFTIELLVESDDIVVSNWSVRGTFDGEPFYGLEPTGQPVHINGTGILRIRDGKIVEHWGGPHCQKGLGLIV